MYFDLTNLTNAEDITSIVKFSNEVTGGIFGVSLLFTIFAIFFLTSRPMGNEKAFAFASFATFISSIMLVPLGILAIQYSLMALGLLLASVFVLLRRD